MNGYYFFISNIFFLFSCANIVPPGGGGKDSTPPVVTRTIPENKTINFAGKEIRIYFSEPVRISNPQQDVFISPPLNRMPTVLAGKNFIRIRFEELLQQNTSYVITLGSGIKDLREGNALTPSYSMVISTGGIIDTLEITGAVIDSYTGNPLKNQLVLAFMNYTSDSLPEKLPDYISVTDDKGNFRLSYLPAGEFRIFSVSDKNRNYKIDLLHEELGICPEGKILLPGYPNADSVSLISFLPDASPPKLQSVSYIDANTLSLSFSEGIIFQEKYFYLFDTVTQAVQFPDLAYLSSPANKQDLSLYFKKHEVSAFTHLNLEVSDSLRNVCRLSRKLVLPTAFHGVKNMLSFSFQDSASINPDDGLVIYSPFPFQSGADTFFAVSDRDSRKIPVQTGTTANSVFVRQTPSWEGGKWYSLSVRKGITFLNGSKIDTSYVFRFYVPPHENFGEISGSIGAFNGDVILNLKNLRTGKIIKSRAVHSLIAEGRAAFSFRFIQPDKYQLYAIADTDKNGIWTTGSIYPLKFPEKVIYYPDIINVKANWTIEDIIIEAEGMQ